MTESVPSKPVGRWRWLGMVAILAAGLWLAGAIWLHEPDNSGIAGGYPGVPDPKFVQQGAYVARLGDCAACHTAIGGKSFAGGLAIDSPIGMIYSTNITPDPATGIGRYSFADFERALRRGIRKDGTSVYPAMPYPAFARLTDGDMRALYAYFMKGVPAVRQANLSNGIRWPLNMRWPVAVWRKWFGPVATPMLGGSINAALVARGEYIVTGPGHCGSCHTPRGAMLQEKAADPRGGPVFLAGGTVIDGWVVPGLRGNVRDGLGRWSQDDIAQFLKTGRIDNTAVFGGMTDVIAWSTQHFTDRDLQAVAAFLKTLPATPTSAGAPPVQVAGAGRSPYEAHCAICHGSDGVGVQRLFPALKHSSIIATADPRSLIKIILEGSTLPPSNRAPSAVAMPGFADALSDSQVANIVNYMRTSWGNATPGNATANAVRRVRKDVSSEPANIAEWQLFTPQPYGSGWSFAPQSHAGRDAAR